jgi:ribosomal protein RSM22 (predicted rRNA methylase)
VTYPGQLDEAVARWLAANSDGGLRAASQELQSRYREGNASAPSNFAAYLTTRLPATYAANLRVMSEGADLMPDFAPQSILDCGAGPGTATWAALAQWPGLQNIAQVEALTAFCELAETLNAQSGLSPLQAAHVQNLTLQKLPDETADLVIASYVLAEVPERETAAIARGLWQRATGVLILIEPGTPNGFARIRAAREALRGGGHIIAPCTHANACPMENNDWCHFKTRLPRSRAHMHAKSATVPFEDEAFSYLAIARDASKISGARIVASTSSGKVSAELKLCDATGIHTESIASRNKPAYKRAKKARWGDLWSVDT